MEVKLQRSVKHLGNTINSRLSDDDDCKVKCSVFIGNVNRVIGNYSNLNNCTKRNVVDREFVYLFIL